MFTIRDFSTVAAAMIDDLLSLCAEITDVTEGAVARSILESTALQIQALDVSLYQMATDAIRVGTYRNFDFSRLPATFGSALVVFTVPTEDAFRTIPQGTIVRVPGSGVRAYRTVEDLVITPNTTTGQVAVRALSSGSVGNTPASTVVQIDDSLPFSATVTNPSAILNGLDQETEDDRRSRFRLFIAGLSKGTVAAVTAGSRSVVITDTDGSTLERVTGAFVHEPFRTDPEGFVGLVKVYIDNGSGTSSQDLLDLVHKTLIGYTDVDGKHPGWISAGIDLEVFGVHAVPLDVACSVVVAPGYNRDTVHSAVVASISRYLSGIQVFEPARVTRLIEAVMRVEGVQDVTFAEPEDDLEHTFLREFPVAFDERIVAGNITVTVT